MSEMFQDPNLITPPKAGQDPQVYSRFVRELQLWANTHGQRLGRIRWLQGKALNFARQVITSLTKNRQERKNLWQGAVASCALGNSSNTTVKYCRKVADVVTASESLRMSFFDMLSKAYPKTYGKIDGEVIEDMEKEDAQDFGTEQTPQVKKQRNSIDDHKYGLSALQAFLRTTKTKLQEWVDNPITRDQGFDLILNTVQDILTLSDNLHDDLVRVQQKVEVLGAEFAQERADQAKLKIKRRTA